MILIDKDLLDFSFSHDVYLLLCKRSERIDEPISRKADNSVISNVLIKRPNLAHFLIKTHLATEISRINTNFLSIYDFIGAKKHILSKNGVIRLRTLIYANK